MRHCVFRKRQGQPYCILFVLDGDEAVVLRLTGPGQPPLTAAELQP